MPPPTLVCITGRPGAGKSTLAAALATRMCWPVTHRDAFVAGTAAVAPDGSIDHVRVNTAFFAVVAVTSATNVRSSLTPRSNTRCGPQP